MRFVLSFAACLMLSSPSLAAPWDVVPVADSEAVTSLTPPRPVQMQRGGNSNKLQTITGLDLNIATTGLGEISAMTLGENGTLYTADKKSGRIWILPDRRQDGKIDLRRPLPVTFDAPSGLAIIEDIIYVADRLAVWAIKPGQEPESLASLARAGSTGDPHILLAGPHGTTLTLGLTTNTQKFRLLELNIQTGEATLLAEGHHDTLHSLAHRPGAAIWAGLGASLGPVESDALHFKSGQSITGFALPGQFETPNNWPVQLKDHIIAAHAGPNAMQLIAIPTEFGQVSNAPRILVEGFLTDTGRRAWGQPGPLLIDKRGLFFADSYNGTLWRLSPQPNPQPKITVADTASLPPNPQTEPDLSPQSKTIGISSSIKGTQIDAKSTILQPSSITYGSKLIKDYDEKKAAEEAEKEKNSPKKKRRMSRKRKQPDE